MILIFSFRHFLKIIRQLMNSLILLTIPCIIVQ